jgi:hypothetical protein
MLIIAANPKHLGARIGFTAVLHTWGSAMPHHPHIHIIVPGGGILPDGKSWVPCRPHFFLHVLVLGRRFRSQFLKRLMTAHEAGRLSFFGEHVRLSEPHAFAIYLKSVRKIDRVVYAKPPFGKPETVLAYLARYTHRVAISNRRLISCDEIGVVFRYKDYRRDGRERRKTMSLTPAEFIRRFLLHVLPRRFHRIRHYGLIANRQRADNLALARKLLAKPLDENPVIEAEPEESVEEHGMVYPCPACGGAMVIIERFDPNKTPRAQPRAPPTTQAEAA